MTKVCRDSSYPTVRIAVDDTSTRGMSIERVTPLGPHDGNAIVATNANQTKSLGCFRFQPSCGIC